jgi:hypothetical protein
MEKKGFVTGPFAQPPVKTQDQLVNGGRAKNKSSADLEFVCTKRILIQRCGRPFWRRQVINELHNKICGNRNKSGTGSNYS